MKKIFRQMLVGGMCISIVLMFGAVFVKVLSMNILGYYHRGGVLLLEKHQ